MTSSINIITVMVTTLTTKKRPESRRDDLEMWQVNDVTETPLQIKYDPLQSDELTFSGNWKIFDGAGREEREPSINKNVNKRNFEASMKTPSIKNG
jgi:hypothetical protein